MPHNVAEFFGMGCLRFVVTGAVSCASDHKCVEPIIACSVDFDCLSQFFHQAALKIVHRQLAAYDRAGAVPERWIVLNQSSGYGLIFIE
jgi:hypothetical protein